MRPLVTATPYFAPVCEASFRPSSRTVGTRRKYDFILNGRMNWLPTRNYAVIGTN